jgi:hypothetical protein
VSRCSVEFAFRAVSERSRDAYPNLVQREGPSGVKVLVPPFSR